MPDSEHEIYNPFDDFSDDEDLAFGQDGDDGERLDAGSRFGPGVAQLTPSAVFCYLLAPYLKLGAMCIPNTGLQLKYSIPALVLFAVLSVFTRQIWCAIYCFCLTIFVL